VERWSTRGGEHYQEHQWKIIGIEEKQNTQTIDYVFVAQLSVSFFPPLFFLCKCMIGPNVLVQLYSLLFKRIVVVAEHYFNS